MSFNTASQDVNLALTGGAFWVIAGLESIGADRADIADRLETVFGGMGGLSYQAAYALIDRYDEAARVGELLNNRTTDRTLYEDQHVGMPGLPESYQYWIMQDFLDPNTGRTFSRLFQVDSAIPLGQQSIRAIAQTQIQEYLNDQEYVIAKHSGEEWFQSGQPRITGAFTAL